MVQKTSMVIPVDKCGVVKVNVFHMYGGWSKKTGVVGNFLRVSIRRIEMNTKLRLKAKVSAILVSSVYFYKKLDGSIMYSDMNGVVLLKKRLTPFGHELHGPAYKIMSRKSFLSSFVGLL